jgi:hypothetical protein
MTLPREVELAYKKLAALIIGAAICTAILVGTMWVIAMCIQGVKHLILGGM